VPLAKAKGKGNQVQNPGRSGHCKWVAVYQKSHWGNPREGGKQAMIRESGNLPGHILVRMHPPMERAVPGQEFDLTGDI
jgi:hypothetical protein